MTFPSNKPFIDKCVISFSHDRHPSRKEADDMALEKARREIAARKKGVSHLILRAKDDEIDRLKFLFPIHGIPLMCYSLGNLLASSLKDIVVVGSLEVKQVLDAFMELVGPRGKNIQFVEEDSESPSLINTLKRGQGCLSLADNELVLFQPGDLPFLYDLEKVLQDKDLKKNNLILWLNSRQQMFPRFQEDPESEFVERNYHYRAIYKGDRLHDIKEPNVYPLNLSVLELDIIDRLHSKRKDGRILIAGLRQALADPFRFLRLLPIIFFHLRHFKKDLARLRPDDHYQFGAHEKTFHKGVSILLKTRILTKVHDDPSFVSDVDALEDWEDFEALTAYAEENDAQQSLCAIHPMGKELLRFKEQVMPDLKNSIPLYQNFPEYMNALYRSLEMPHVPFDKEGNYNFPGGQTGKVKNAYLWYVKKCQAIVSGRNEQADTAS